MKKRIFADLLVAATVVFMTATTVSAVEPKMVKKSEIYSIATEIDISTIISDISDAITKYYYSKDMSEIFVPDSTFESEILSYLKYKN